MRPAKPAKWGVALLATAMLVIALPAASSASNFGSQCCAGASGTTNGVFLTDNVTWAVARMQLITKYFNGVTDALNAEYAPTDLGVSMYTPSQCLDTQYDMCVFDFDYGDNNLNGWHSCAGTTSGAHPNTTCSLSWVRINYFFDPPAKRIACHEMAHGVGLRHTNEQASCVKRTADGGDSSSLSAHDVAHINGEY